MAGSTGRSSAGSWPWWMRRLGRSGVLRGCALAALVVLFGWVASERAVLEGVMDRVAPCPPDQHHHLRSQLDDHGLQKPMMMCEFDVGRHPMQALDERDRYERGYAFFGEMMVGDRLRQDALEQGRARHGPE